MPVENSWHTPQRITLTRLIGDVTLEEMVTSTQKGSDMIDSGIEPVYSLVDMSAMVTYPTRLSDMRYLTQHNSPKLACIIVYGIQNKLVAFLASTFTQFVKTRYVVVQNQEEALKLIAMWEDRARIS